MKRWALHPPLAAVLLIGTFLLTAATDPGRLPGPEKKHSPGDWFWRQRSYPTGVIDPAARRRSLEQARALRAVSPLDGGATWIPRGPSNIGGRITAMAISIQNPSILYAGAADGGVQKSTDGGRSWLPLFDDQPSLSMGAIAVDPTNDEIVYVGTGESNSSGDSYQGFGMVKSTDGGTSWFPLGLDGTAHIGKIVVDPLNPRTLYVAAVGSLYSPNPDRGVYKSTDGGASWFRVLFINDSTGVVDLAINPQNPSILLAAAWQRMRGPEGRKYVGGVHSGIHRSTDAGATWTRLEGGLPVPAATVGRPAIAIAASNPAITYAAFADDPGYFMGCYRSTDGGVTWSRTHDSGLGSLYSSFGWYFGKILVSPANPDAVFILGVSMAKSSNGGATWTMQNTSHVDHHALVFHPTDPALMFVGNDGGFCGSTNGGASWTRAADQNLFITQFYAGCIDPLEPQRSMGGTQDNGTPRTMTGVADSWYSINGGDGFYAVIDYTDNNFQYAESQYGAIRRTTDNWVTSMSGTTGISSSERRNWSTPILLDPHNPAVLYTGTQRLYRSTDRAASWTPLTGDLTGGMVPGYTAYATITTIDVAPSDSSSILVGTDDAMVWISTDRGATWRNVSSDLPDRWVTRVRFDPADAMIAYVTLSGYRADSRLPHVYRTTDAGFTWSDCSGNLPEAPVNVILVDPLHRERLYVGTDVGCFFSTDTGGSWQAMGSGLPNVVVSDMQLHAGSRIARAFTHGRSAWDIRVDDLVTTTIHGDNLPAAAFLEQNYPNPFNPATTLEFSLSQRSAVRITLHDVPGRLVATLVDDVREPGVYRIAVDGSRLSSGVYFCRLVATPAAGNPYSLTRKMVLTR
jgi:photosystem II stability/assembly factor-like uncharacterized protein